MKPRTGTEQKRYFRLKIMRSRGARYTTPSSRENHYANVNSNIYEEVGGPSEVTLHTRAANEFERSSSQNDEDTLRTQQKTNELKADPNGNNGDKNEVLQMKGWQLTVCLCILIFVVITLIAVGSYLGYQAAVHKDSIGELQSQIMQNATGQWQRWSPWGACSVSCGTGLQTRDRTCFNSNQKYEEFGCPGDSKEYQMCSANNCIDQWQMWSPWGRCSVSCGIGLQTRARTCFNRNRNNGEYGCHGDSKEYRMCSAQNCLDGGWGTWSNWVTCSTTCGVGMTHRRRHCNSPAPSQFGKPCEGDSTDFKLCNTNPCSEDIITFTARNLENLTISYLQALIFQTVEINEGAGYNSKTGVFTVPKDGVYIFRVHICVARDNFFRFVFNVMGSFKQRMSVYGYNDCSTTSTIQILKRSDLVWIMSLSRNSTLYQNSYRWNTFSGVLIRP